MNPHAHIFLSPSLSIYTHPPMQEPTDSKISESLKEQVRRHLPKEEGDRIPWRDRNSEGVLWVRCSITGQHKINEHEYQRKVDTAVSRAIALESELNSRIAGQAEARRNFVEA